MGDLPQPARVGIGWALVQERSIRDAARREVP
jgi:hypothetical protein